MSGLVGLLRRLRYLNSPPETPPKSPQALRFGILGAARIGPNALIIPALSHPDVVIHSVASRDRAKASAYASKYKISKVHSGGRCYQDLLDDPEVDAVYIALPNGRHFEWTMRALELGKHVLIEKPMADTAAEAQHLVDLAAQKGLVLLEAIHWNFHPSAQRTKQLIDSDKLGRIKAITADFAVPNLPDGIIFLKDDIRYNYDLGGGVMMDMGVYAISAIRYLTSTEPIKVTAAQATGHVEDPLRVDRAMHARYLMPSAIEAETFADFSMQGWGPMQLLPRAFRMSVRVQLERGEIELRNYPLPHLFHSIKIRPHEGKARTETAYTFEQGPGKEWWSSYRYQLEAFVDKIRGRTPQFWPAEDEAVKQMRCVEGVYTAADMPIRPASEAFNSRVPLQS